MKQPGGSVQLLMGIMSSVRFTHASAGGAGHQLAPSLGHLRK